MQSTVKVPPQLFAKLNDLKKFGLSPEQAVAILKRDYPALADQIVLIPGDAVRMDDVSGQGVTGLDYDMIRRATAHGHVDGHELVEAKRREVEAKSEANNLEQSYRDQVEQRVFSLEQAVSGASTAIASHLVQHQLQMQGELEALNPGQSLKFLFDGRSERDRADVVSRLEPEMRQALEDAANGKTPALPETLEDDSQTITVKQKPRGLFGARN